MATFLSPCPLLLLLVPFILSFELEIYASAFVANRLPIAPRRNIGRGTPFFHQLNRYSPPKRVVSQSSASANDGDVAEVPGSEELDRLLEVAVVASKSAGKLITEFSQGAAVTKLKANPRDLLTEVDPLCEKIIRETILETFPTHAILGEEGVPPGKEASAAALDGMLRNPTSDFLWIVDPIDGTTNFVHGMPLCMPSVAVAYKGMVVAGVIYDPHRDECFSAKAGHGATLNGNAMKVGEQSSIGDAVVAMGSPPALESLEMSLRGVQGLMPVVRTIRMLGSAALMLAWVACGRLTCYWEYDLSSWDIAAGALLVKEAGGEFTDLDGNPYDLRVRKMIASNGKVHREVLDTLHKAGVV